MLRKPTDITRTYLEAIQDRDQAIKEVASIDGLYSMPQLISVLQDLKKITENDIEALLKQLQPRIENLRSKNYKEETDIFTKYGEDIVSQLKILAKQKITTLTKEYINDYISSAINPILKKLPADAAQGENKKIYDSLIANLKTALDLICSLVIYNDMDYKQNHVAETVAKEGGKAIASLFVKKEVTKRDELEAPLLLMKLFAKHITITEKTLPLWLQAERWLMGLHYRSYNIYPDEQKDLQGNIKKNAKDEYELVKNDMLDGYLGKYGVSKYYLSFYHRHRADNINERIANYKNIPQQENVAPELIKKEVKPKEKASAFLSRYKDQPIDVQFAMLIDALDNCELTEDDNRRLNHYLEAGKKKVAKYTQAWFSTWWVPTFFVSRSHTASANETLSAIKHSQDVKNHLHAFYELWIETDDPNSKEMHPALTEMLTGAFSILVNSEIPPSPPLQRGVTS